MTKLNFNIRYQNNSTISSVGAATTKRKSLEMTILKELPYGKII